MSTDSIVTPDANPAATDAPGNDLEVVQYEDYWGVQETFTYFLPDGKQFFEIKPMDEGAKTRFQKMTNKGIRMNQRTQDAHLDIDPSDERHTLLKESIVGWKIMQRDPKAEGGWSELPCPEDENRRKRVIADNFASQEAKFNPKVIQDLEFFIRTSNPWMQADMDMEELEKERERIDLLIKQKKEHEAGELVSANK